MCSILTGEPARALFADLFGHLLSELASEHSHSGSLAESLHLRLACLRIEPHMVANGPEHLEHLRDFLLGKQVDLQIELIAMIGSPGHPVLFHEDESSQQNAFQG